MTLSNSPNARARARVRWATLGDAPADDLPGGADQGRDRRRASSALQSRSRSRPGRHSLPFARGHGHRLRGAADRQPPRHVHAPGRRGAACGARRGRDPRRRAADRRSAHPQRARRGRPAAAHRGGAAGTARRAAGPARPAAGAARTVVLAVATESATNLQAAINGFVDSAASIVSSQILGVFNTLSFVLGLLVIPAWILTIVADEREIKRRAGSLLPVAMRRDAAAIVTIMDRAFGTFLRHRVLLAIVSGSARLGRPGVHQRDRPDADPLHGDRRDAARLPAAHPGARLLPRHLPDPAVHPGERPGRGADGVRRVLDLGQGRGRARRRAGLEGRPRRASRGAAPGDRRAQPVRHRLARGGGAR